MSDIMSKMRTDRTKPVFPPRLGMASWHRYLACLFGVITLVVTLYLVVPTMRFSFRGADVLLWLAYISVFTLSNLSISRVEEGAWTGYPYLFGLVAWLTLGLHAALGVVIIGSALCLVLRARFGARFGMPALTRLELASVALGRMAITGLPLVVAWAVAHRFGFVAPLRVLSTHNIVPLVLALLSALAASQGIGILLVGEFSEVENRLRWAVRNGRVGVEILAILVALTLALIGTQTAPGVTILLLALVVTQAVRHRSVGQTEQTLKRRVEELSVLNRVSDMTANTLDLDDLIASIHEQVRQATGAPVVYIALYNPLHSILEYPLVLIEGQRVTWDVRPLDDSADSSVIRNQAVLHLNADNPDELARAGVVPTPHERRYPHLLGLPLIVGSEILGVLMVQTQKRQHLDDPMMVSLLQTIARQGGLALHNASLYTRSLEFVRSLSLINSSVQNMMLNLDKTDAIEKVCEAALAIGQSSGAALYLHNAEDDTAQLVHAIGLSADQRVLYASLPQARDVKRTEPRILTDVKTTTIENTLVTLARTGGFRAMIEIPLRSTSAPLGILSLYYAEPHYSSPSEIELLLMLGSQVSSVLDNTELFRALETYAFEMAQLAHLTRASVSTLDVRQVANGVGEILCEMMVVNRTTIAMIDAEGGTLYVVGSANSTDSEPTGVPDELPLQLPEVHAFIGQESPRAQAFHMDDSRLSSGLEAVMERNHERSLALVPMMMNNALMGIIVFGSREKRVFSDREWQLIDMATNQVAAQLQNAHLYTVTREELRQRLEQLTLIEDIARQISSTLDFNQIIRNMLDAAIRSTQSNYAALILLPDEQSVRVIVVDFTNGRFSRYFTSTPREDSIVGRVIRSGKPVLTPNTRSEPGYAAPRTGSTYLSSLAVPLMQENHVIGVLTVESERASFFSREHISFLSNLAGHAVISIDNARRLEERQYQVKVLTSLQSLALRLSSAVDTRSVAHAVLETTFHIFEAHEAAIYRYNDQHQTFGLLASLRPNTHTVVSEQSMIVPDVAHEAALTGEIQIVQTERETTDGAASPYASSISIPLKRGNRVYEVLCVAFADQRNFPLRDLDTLSLLSSQAAGHLENATLLEQIRAGSERMAAILNSTRDGVIVLDQKGGVVETNPAARRLLGDRLNAYIRDAIGQRSAGKPDTGTLRDLSTRLAADQVTRRQFSHQTEAGDMFIEEIGSPVVDAHNQPVGWLLVLRDVTEEKLLDVYRDEVTSMVVHDLRGPLASIISSLNLATDEIAHEADADLINTMLRLSSDSANSLMSLVESLLDIARLEARAMPLRLQPTRVEVLVEKASKALSATLQQNAISLRTDVPPDVQTVEIDVDIVTRVLINLLDNAIRHTPEAHEVLVAAELVDEGSRVLVRVADSGRGLPPEERERVFEKFKQAKTNAASGKRGTGLGLTFCRLAVEAHGGRIWVEETSPLSGASFAFTLPVAAS